MSEIKKGDKVVAMWGVMDEVYTVALKPKLKSRVEYLVVEDDKGKRTEVLSQWWRKADPEEVRVGSRLR